MHKRAVLYLTNLKTRNETLEDGTTLTLTPEGSGHKGKSSPQGAPGAGGDPPKKKKKKAKKAKGVSKEICLKFQRSACSEPCPHGRRHVISDAGGGMRATRRKARARAKERRVSDRLGPTLTRTLRGSPRARLQKRRSNLQPAQHWAKEAP